MPTLHVSTLDAVIVAGYLVAAISLGFWFGRKKMETDDAFFLADREASWPLVGASLFCSNISTQQFVGQAGLAYAIGLAAGAFQMVGAVCFLLLATFFVDVYLGLRLKTSPEFYEHRYNRSCRTLVSALNIALIVLASTTASLYTGAIVLCALFGWGTATQFALAVAGIAVAAGAYTIFGGLRSVLWTDLFQAGMLVCGGAVTLVLGIRHAGGIPAVLATYSDSGGSMWSLFLSWDHPFGWLAMATGALILGVHMHCTDHDFVQRALAARSVFDAKLGAIFAAFLKVVALFIVSAPGVVAAKLIPHLANPDRAYAQMVIRYIPSGFSGLVLASLLAAILGSVSAGLTASSSLVVYDFILRARPGISERNRVRLGRAVMLLILLFCASLAPGIARFRGVYGYMVEIGSLLGPPVFVCAVAGILTRRANARGAIATLAVGMGLGLAGFALLQSPVALADLPRYFRGALNLAFVDTVVCAGVMALVSRLFPGTDRAASEIHRARRSPALDRGQRTILTGVIVALVVLWVAVVTTFSPLGLAAPRAATTADVAAAEPGPRGAR
ncbi:MAG TPA: sodium/solute symporter [Opitutaceae bacterium]|nr:sodium/solute symporter [Opitutaceae bacterium]